MAEINNFRNRIFSYVFEEDININTNAIGLDQATLHYEVGFRASRNNIFRVFIRINTNDEEDSVFLKGSSVQLIEQGR